MLGHRDHDLIPGLHIAQAIAVRDQVQCLGRILREDDLFRTLRPDKLSRPFPGILIDIRRLDGQRIGTAMRIRIAATIVATDRLDHLLRFLCRRTIIQISNFPAIDLPVQQREIL
jgi:hypothetical protein